MGLSIGVREGAVIDVDGKALQVNEVSNTRINVTFEGRTYALNEFESVELCPYVYLSMGKPKEALTSPGVPVKEWDLLPRLLFEAPRHISIQRKRKVYGTQQ
jgi:hypothetical protein